MKMECWRTLRLSTLPYWSQVEVCIHLRPVKVSAHRSYEKQKLQPRKPLVEKTIKGARKFLKQKRDKFPVCPDLSWHSVS